MGEDTERQDNPVLRLRVLWEAGAMLGPGKADLLQHIVDTGSIAAAGRRMSMSYKRAWMLVETMNDTFRGPLVESSRGGARGGGAQLTPLGRQVLECYRALERITAEAGTEKLAELSALRKAPDEKR
jgi:molybdate transport system regulatory protein